MKIITWNVNSIKQRLDHFLLLLKEEEPDVVCLQELKCISEDFPSGEILMAGYHSEVVGQKAYNGVALISKERTKDVSYKLAGNEQDEQARFIEATFTGQSGGIRIASLYFPNGNPVISEKYPYKLNWMDRVIAHSKLYLKQEIPFILAGDFNVIPRPQDAAHPQSWEQDALYLPQTRKKYQELLNLGLFETIENFYERREAFTFWDYQGQSWQRNNGIRIDHILLSPQLADKATDARILKDFRALEKPSDHVPVLVEIDL